MDEGIADVGEPGADGRRRINVGRTMMNCGFKVDLKRIRFFKNLLNRVKREYHDIHPVTTTDEVGSTRGAATSRITFGIDHAHNHEMSKSFQRASVPPQYLAIKSVGTSKGRRYTARRGVSGYELRFCFASECIKLVRTDNVKNTSKQDGGMMQWEWSLHHLWRAHLGEADEDGNSSCTFAFNHRPSFLTRRYSLGQHAWKPKNPPGFLTTLEICPCITLICNKLDMTEALSQVKTQCPLFSSDCSIDILQQISDSELGYLHPDVAVANAAAEVDRQLR